MTVCVQSLDDITPAWLTDALRQHGVLRQGQVTGIDKDCSSPFGATVCKLGVAYSDDAPSPVPRNLFLKLPARDAAFYEHGKREIRFYQVMMAREGDFPIPRCYHAAYDDASGALSLLLADLSATHQPLEHELPPTERQCYQLMEVLARLHAAWWDSPRLGVDIGTIPIAQALTDEFNDDSEHYQAFAAFLEDRLLPSRRAVYENVLARLLPVKQKRFAEGKHLTLAHGDAHAWNFLYPKADGDSPCVLDWEALHVNVGPNDVAYLMAVFWHPARRAWLEESLLKHYHAQLKANGVAGYSWEDCWYDYRLSVINLLFMPVWWWVHGTPAFLWWYRLERLMLAYENLGCAELLD